jgi:hypothetical protein
MSEKEKPWHEPGVVDQLDVEYNRNKFLKIFGLTSEEFRNQYLVDFKSFKKRVEACETKAVRDDERCPEDGIKRIIDGEEIYLCDKCWESLQERNKLNETMQIKIEWKI